MNMVEKIKIAATYLKNNRTGFRVWAPLAKNVSLKLLASPEKLVRMQKDDRGYWSVETDAGPGALYRYVIDNEKERPDPASFFQPEGVHGPSMVIDHDHHWEDAGWKGVPLQDMIMYELHIGTLTPEGTFHAAVSLLDEIKDIGVNAVEIMPVAQFPGERNWGYDGVYLFAVQNSYGGPDGLKYFVNECHKRGIAVILDVVYNHFGPEGNYTRDYGPYFTNRYKSPWGEAINFDGHYSCGVRDFFIENALYWFRYFHIDALRLDAIHGIYDMSARHFLRELSERVNEFSIQQGRKFCLIAESDLNDPLVARPYAAGGYGLDGLWCDDFHHALHTLVTGEKSGYYMDFKGTDHLAISQREGFIYSGQYSEFRKKNHGSSSKDLPAESFVVFAQNHDQVGNRMKGERLASLVSFEALKLAAGIVMLSPYVPLLFMGEEYGETAPFQYFVSHSDRDLIEGVRQGRRKEFETFEWDEDPPDPQAPVTYTTSGLDWKKRYSGNNNILLHFYKELIALRKEVPALSVPDKNDLDVWSDKADKTIALRRQKGESIVFMVFNFNKGDIMYTGTMPGAEMKKIFDSSEQKWNGHGPGLPDVLTEGAEIIMPPESFVVYAENYNGLKA